MARQQMDPEVVKRMYLEERKSTHEIAAALGRTPSGVSLLLNRIGVPLRTQGGAAESRTLRALGFVPTREWLQQAISAFGGNALECSKHYGFKYPTFVDILRRNDIPRLAPEVRRNVGAPRVEIPIEEAVRLSSLGVTYSELAQKYKVTYGIIMRRMKEAGHIAPKNKQRKYEGKKTLTSNKRRILQELGAICSICGDSRSVTLCHIHANSDGGPLVKENILILCPNHHDYFDKGKLTKEEFSKIKTKVREAEKYYNFKLSHYGDW